jgi:polyisoprenoid-binding protein YceI
MQLSRYTIDCEMSRVVVRAFASGAPAASSPTLIVRDLDGAASFMPGTFERACVQIKVNPASVFVAETDDPGPIEAVMLRDMLETEKYPEIFFCSSNVSASKAGDGRYWINLVGDLSLHGVTGNQPVAAQVSFIGDTLHAHGEFTLQHASYNMKAGSFAGGAFRLKEEVRCSFDIVARRQHRVEEPS